MGDDYTPTTEDVRAVYAFDLDESEFDRWLVQHDRETMQRAADIAREWSQRVTDEDERIAYYLRLGAQSVWFRLQEELQPFPEDDA